MANRPIVKASHKTTGYVVENPGKTSAYVGATLLSGGAVFAQTLTTGMFLGAAGGFVGSLASHDFTINTTKDAASVAVSTALGGLIPAPAKLFFPAALATGVYGMNTHDSDLMWEGGLGAAFSFVPLVKEVRHSFNTGKNITVGGAHFSRSLDDSMLRPPVNSNVPIKPTANINVIPLPHVVEATEVNGIQQLAQKLSGGVRTAKDYRQIYMTSEPTRTGRLGSNGTLTMDAGTRTLNASKKGSSKLALGSQGTGTFHRPVDLLETTERTLASYQKMKAGRANQTPYDPRAMENMLYQTYGVNNVTSSTLPSLSMQNVKLAGKELCLVTDNGRGFKIVFDQKGFPIFDPHVVYDTRISFDTIKTGSRPADFKEATKQLKENILNGSVSRDLFNEMQINAIMKESRKIPDFTWHHHQDLGRMQLIPSEIHNHELMKHVGGFSMAH